MMRYIMKCPACRNYTESEIIVDDTGSYIECEWCGCETDVSTGDIGLPDSIS